MVQKDLHTINAAAPSCICQGCDALLALAFKKLLQEKANSHVIYVLM